MADYAHSIQELIDAFGRLPGIGPKSAQRITFHLLKVDKAESQRLVSAITSAVEKVSFCTRCFNLSEGELCAVCLDDQRDQGVLCVVEEPRDVVAIERTREFRGRYHVLGGAIDHLQGIGPDQLKIKELVGRVAAEHITEVILCTNPNIEGEATALYLTRVLDVPGLAVTRIASGLPVGGDLEYADELTLGRALEGRRSVGRESTDTPERAG
ncbi:MAG: recombination mediator RecR [Acidimicrobiales bacterium]